jgi:hypothetical protein
MPKGIHTSPRGPKPVMTSGEILTRYYVYLPPPLLARVDEGERRQRVHPKPDCRSDAG